MAAAIRAVAQLLARLASSASRVAPIARAGLRGMARVPALQNTVTTAIGRNAGRVVAQAAAATAARPWSIPQGIRHGFETGNKVTVYTKAGKPIVTTIRPEVVPRFTHAPFSPMARKLAARRNPGPKRALPAKYGLYPFARPQRNKELFGFDRPRGPGRPPVRTKGITKKSVGKVVMVDLPGGKYAPQMIYRRRMYPSKGPKKEFVKVPYVRPDEPVRGRTMERTRRDRGYGVFSESRSPRTRLRNYLNDPRPPYNPPSNSPRTREMSSDSRSRAVLDEMSRTDDIHEYFRLARKMPIPPPRSPHRATLSFGDMLRNAQQRLQRPIPMNYSGAYGSGGIFSNFRNNFRRPKLLGGGNRFSFKRNAAWSPHPYGPTGKEYPPTVRGHLNRLKPKIKSIYGRIPNGWRDTVSRRTMPGVREGYVVRTSPRIRRSWMKSPQFLTTLGREIPGYVKSAGLYAKNAGSYVMNNAGAFTSIGLGTVGVGFSIADARRQAEEKRLAAQQANAIPEPMQPIVVEKRKKKKKRSRKRKSRKRKSKY